MVVSPKGYKNFKWLYDVDSPYEAHALSFKRTCLSVDTKYQHMEILETIPYGKILVLDGKIQSSELDGFIYHEALVWPAAVAAKEVKKALILGGGEGSTLKEVLKLNSVEKAVMVDIDEEVIINAKKYLHTMHEGSFSDPRTELIIEDGRSYLKRSKEVFDLVIVDVTDPIEEGPSYLLFTEEFYNELKPHISENGVFVTQAGMAKLDGLLCVASVKKTVAKVFPVVSFYHIYVPSYSVSWGFVTGSKKVDPRSLTPEYVDQFIKNNVRSELKLYDGQTHLHMFSLPKYIREGIEKEGQLIKDDKPIYVY